MEHRVYSSDQCGLYLVGSDNVPALQGVTLNNEPQTMYPGEVPRKLPNKQYWETNQFDFTSFRPMEQHPERARQHLRVDKVLEYLIGDKLEVIEVIKMSNETKQVFDEPEDLVRRAW